jgi:hypothetical protein
MTLGIDHHNEPDLRRTNGLDALAGVIPAQRREALAGILTDDDVATLRHLAEGGIGPNTLRALASDLGYLEAWAHAPPAFRCLGLPLRDSP